MKWNLGSSFAVAITALALSMLVSVNDLHAQSTWIVNSASFSQTGSSFNQLQPSNAFVAPITPIQTSGWNAPQLQITSGNYVDSGAGQWAPSNIVSQPIVSQPYVSQPYATASSFPTAGNFSETNLPQTYAKPAYSPRALNNIQVQFPNTARSPGCQGGT